MSYLSPREKHRRRAQRVRTITIVCAAFVLITLLDFPLLHLIYHDQLQIDKSDLYRLLRIMGYLGTWIIVASIYIAHDRNRHRGLAIILSATLAGMLAELLKLSIARERPINSDGILAGMYHFRGLLSGFADGSSGLGFPSSHAAVAFGGCMMLGCFLPRAKILLLCLATGCGFTRLLTSAHFASDVFGGALLGWASASIMCHFASVHVEGLKPRYRMPF